MKDQTLTKQLRLLISAIVLLLIFEGIVRKLVGSELKVAIFFAKDAVILIMGILVANMPKPQAIQALWQGYMRLLLLFVPVVLATAFQDPILAVFGAERYLLMPMVAFGVYGAFENAGMDAIRSYVRKLGLLLIPTTLLALVQLRLPATHWVNRGVSGDVLEGFSAAEVLRVGSTFPFVAQFCMYLKAQIFVCAIALSDLRSVLLWKKIILSILPLALLLSSYATGSRTAVIGNAVIVGIAIMMIMVKGKGGGLGKISALVTALFLSFFTLKVLFPQAFVVYGEREEGKFLTLSSENKDRTLGMVTDLFKGDLPVSLFGNGLGVMSNGSEKLSNYAYSWRRSGYWTESDYATTLFEGGIYLMLVWYGFRFWVIIHTVRRVLQGISGDFLVPAIFCEAFIILEGLMGTLGIQPPAAIWWWMAVGLVTLLWQKSKEAEGGSGASMPELEVIAAVPVRKVRGRSIYAEQLHNSTRK